METPAEVGERLGIPPARLERLIELPEVAAAIVEARDHPDVAPEAIFAALELPVVDPDGLDLDKLELELSAMRRLGERESGEPRDINVMRTRSLLQGRYERERGLAARRLTVMVHVLSLLGEQGSEHPAVSNVNAARTILEEEIAERNKS